MKTINQILILAKEELLKSRDTSDPKFSDYTGLCELSTDMYYEDIITDNESALFDSYIDANPSVRGYKKHFYVYFWDPYLIAPRLRWLYKHIKLTK